jgi:hypothetical protein
MLLFYCIFAQGAPGVVFIRFLAPTDAGFCFSNISRTRSSLTSFYVRLADVEEFYRQCDPGKEFMLIAWKAYPRVA